VTCGICRNCRAGQRHLCNQAKGIGVDLPGGFAKYVTVPAGNVFPVPGNISDDIAAILDPLGNATHAALSFDLIGEDVLITGAGPIGIMSTAICRFVGARNIVVTDVNDYRLALANQMGASRVVNVAKEPLPPVMNELGMKEGFDVGLEMSGNPDAMRSMLDTMRHGSRVALLGIPPSDTAVDWNQIIFKGLRIKGIYGREMFETWYKMTKLIQSGMDISPVITHHLSASNYQQGFELLKTGQAAKIILDWSAI
ncbi:MAG: L-threonine 3-dehydrogenase, partial [Gammaproteobacteria bacterium]|nr:L-threonine 3-dehydrogenase [Gammaproteobacteria bacterium]